MPSLESLAKLTPSFKADGKVTAGNASSMNDGAAAVVVSSRGYAEKNNLKPIAHIIGYAQVAVEPKYLFAAPSYAIPKLLKKVDWELSDVDLFEINEAFAAQVLSKWLRPRRSRLGLGQGQRQRRRDRTRSPTRRKRRSHTDDSHLRLERSRIETWCCVTLFGRR